MAWGSATPCRSAAPRRRYARRVPRVPAQLRRRGQGRRGRRGAAEVDRGAARDRVRADGPSNVVKAGMRQTRVRDGREDRSPSQDLGRFEWSETPDLRTQGPSTGAALSVLTLPPRPC